MRLLILVAGLAVLLAGTAARAAEPGQGRQTRSLARNTMNNNKYSNIKFERGVLNQGPYGQWFLDEKVLIMTDNSRVSSRDDALGLATLENGCEAMVLGQLINGQLVVQRVFMFSSDESIKRGTFNLRRVATPPRKGSPTDLR